MAGFNDYQSGGKGFNSPDNIIENATYREFMQQAGGKEGLESYGSRYKTFRKIEQGTYDAGSHTHSVTTNASTTGSTGSTQGHSHTTDWQPWLKVAVWKRTA